MTCRTLLVERSENTQKTHISQRTYYKDGVFAKNRFAIGPKTNEKSAYKHTSNWWNFMEKVIFPTMFHFLPKSYKGPQKRLPEQNEWDCLLENWSRNPRNPDFRDIKENWNVTRRKSMSPGKTRQETITTKISTRRWPPWSKVSFEELRLLAISRGHQSKYNEESSNKNQFNCKWWSSVLLIMVTFKFWGCR